MKILSQIFILLAFNFLGELIASILPFTFPGSLIGLILLFISLVTKIIRPNQIKDLSTFLQSNMAFLFVPLCVGMMEYFDLIELHMLEIILVLFASTIITMIATALIAQRGSKK